MIFSIPKLPALRELSFVLLRRFGLGMLSLLLMSRAQALSLDDPFATEAVLAQSSVPVCGLPGADQALALADLVDLALCSQPQTRELWAASRYQAAQVGVAWAAYLPNLNATASAGRVNGDGGSPVGGSSYSQSSLGLNLSWLVSDFGGRDANLENSRQLLLAAQANRDAGIQSVMLAVVQAWSQWQAARAAVEAALISEKASAESYKAARRRYEVGSATPADSLQAKTAWSQAALARIKAEGELRIARGSLMNALGRDADDALEPAAVTPPDADQGFEVRLQQLMTQAKASRPDLLAAQAQVKAADAAVTAAKAAGRPSISLTAGVSDSHSSLADSNHSGSLGLNVSIPLFSGFATTYRIRAAQELRAQKEAQQERTARQISLEVWKAYHTLQTAGEALRASSDLLTSAAQAQKVAKGRFDAGVGGILDLLNADGNLASARQQDIQARFNWLSARYSLAQALGQLSRDNFRSAEAAGERLP